MSEQKLILNRLEQISNALERIQDRLSRLERGKSQKAWLSGSEVCEMLQICRRTLQKYRSDGLIAYSTIGQKLYYRQTDIQAMLKRHLCPVFNH